MLIVLLGGARSGKSSLALRLARAQEAPVVFLATGEAGDDEMAARIARHRAERPPEWQTIEEPLALADAVAGVDPAACLVVDCLSLWSANRLARDRPERIEAEAGVAARAARARPGLTVVVGNEAGLGVVPATPLGRTWRDLNGRVNAAWVAESDRAYLVVAGRALALEDAASILGRDG
ncbi:MAG TPA: bifunctional adenosylcobinamide kinase/adenosylcobinamide-phosphate guanylyltransferase [Gaiellaceae bacterium]|nr:bifunctional adenosylcobinamide kinase/adenosylcobinamide-phosphate guanylyltransferase [Gaiellaceae bacterium]HVV59593.1 bifunctional adenosylcobinamide kinase/adenosylcobinamide-phosphate guanylyltransferase [Gaiellaceae bacterium]